jgi:N-methylhydantoinase A
MRRAVRSVSVERGRDPRVYSLVAFGGAGGLHAASLAAELEMREVIVPIAPGLFSSLGLLFSDVAATRLTNHRAPLTAGSLPGVRAEIGLVAQRATDALRDELSAAGDVDVEVSVALRYVGQSSSLMLPVDVLDDDDEAAVRSLSDAFHTEHARVYGHAAEGEAVETVSLMVRAVSPRDKFTFREIGGAYDTGDTSPNTERDMYFGPVDGTRSTKVVTRADLERSAAEGPAVIEEFDTTIIVPPGAIASHHETGSILLSWAGTSGETA